MNEDKVLETVLEKLNYTFLKDALVKPLDPIMVTKEITEQIPTGEKDEEGYNKYETKTETKEVESEWATGIVLALPSSYKEEELTIGDKVVYNKKFAKDFDLFKNSQYLYIHDIFIINILDKPRLWLGFFFIYTLNVNKC